MADQARQNSVAQIRGLLNHLNIGTRHDRIEAKVGNTSVRNASSNVVLTLHHRLGPSRAVSKIGDRTPENVTRSANGRIGAAQLGNAVETPEIADSECLRDSAIEQMLTDIKTLGRKYVVVLIDADGYKVPGLLNIPIKMNSLPYSSVKTF